MSVVLPRVYSIPPGAPFLATLADAFLDGAIVPGAPDRDDPLSLADATIYVPTRRAARNLRLLFASRAGGASILPTILPLGDVDEDDILFASGGATLALDPPIDPLERILTLAPLVRAWKSRLPSHVAALFGEPVTVPASAAEAIWLARDLADLLDEVEREEVGWDRLPDLVDRDLALWWQVTREFLDIVADAWPQHLAAARRSNPAAHRSRLIDAEAARLAGATGPVIAAGSTGSIPATARLLSVIARLPRGAVVLPGLDLGLDVDAWDMLTDATEAPAIYGHPQYGLARLVGELGILRHDVVELGLRPPALTARARIVSEAMRPAATTQRWASHRDETMQDLADGALDDVTLVEAANERDEALAIALALRQALARPGETAALVTADRALARRVAAELARFGIAADDSAGTPLEATPPAMLLRLLVMAAMRPGDPVALLALLKHPLTSLGAARDEVRRAVEAIDLLALRGGSGRPDIATLDGDLARRLTEDRRGNPVGRFTPAELARAIAIAARVVEAAGPLVALRAEAASDVPTLARATVAALEAFGRREDGSLVELYRGEAGETLAGVLRGLVGAPDGMAILPGEWPEVLAALTAGQTVKPRQGSEPRVAIWGALEARLQRVDTLVCGGLNEGVWPSRADPGAFMSRVMKAGIALDPPERRIGQAAHDFAMALGNPRVLLSRSARTGDAPSVASRWLQRLLVYVGDAAATAMRARGETLLSQARHHANDRPEPVNFAARPNEAPPVAARPTHFSVTEIETLRRDPYAIYARKILGLRPLEPLLRDPGAAERGTLFHDILHSFTAQVGSDLSGDPSALLLTIARAHFDDEALPADIDAVWWPRFVAMAPEIVRWEREDRSGVVTRLAEIESARERVGATGVTLSARADRIDLRPADLADILDYKTGTTPRKGDAHRLVAPQLSLEAALLNRGAFAEAGNRTAADLAYVRLRANGKVDEESILEFNRARRAAGELAAEAWERLERLLYWYGDPANGYLSRALPYRADDADGDYDHLARVLEWSAGGDDGAEEGGE